MLLILFVFLVPRLSRLRYAVLQWAAAVAWCGSGCRDVGSMRSSTVSAPVQSCSAPLTPSSKKYAAVELLTRQTLYFIVEVSY